MSEHTPGPWSVPYYDDNPGDQGWWIHNGKVGSDEFAIAVTFDGNPNSEADARLISAAPDMYAVLRELAECSEYWSEYDVPLGIHDRIAAALAKAVSQ